MKFARLHYFLSQTVGGDKRYYAHPCPKVGHVPPTPHKLGPWCRLVYSSISLA